MPNGWLEAAAPMAVLHVPTHHLLTAQPAATSNVMFDLAALKPDILKHAVVKLAKVTDGLPDLRLLSRPPVDPP
jgi:hypothetical protein